jgi:hypothetical protein
MGWGFGGFWRVEGVDMRICWGFCGDYFRVLDRYAVKDAKGSKKERSSARVNACPSGRGVSKYGDSGCARMTSKTYNRRSFDCAQSRMTSKNKQRRNAGVPPLRAMRSRRDDEV